MNEMNSTNRKPRLLSTVILPVLICAAIAVVFELIADCRLIRIEDNYTWAILSGAYGAPDWRVLEMNPLLAQLLALLYRVAPRVPWYGLTMAVLLSGACAAMISLCAQKRGGLFPAAILVAPICALLNQSMISTTVCAASAAAGFLLMQQGLREKGEHHGSLVVGLVLYVLGAAVNLVFAAIVSVALVICLLPCCIRDERVKALCKGVPLAAVILAALFGYQSLMFNSTELSAWRRNYARYDRLQHSTLPDEMQELLSTYGTMDFGEGEDHDDHDHAEGEDHDHDEEADDAERGGIFYQAGLSLNDAQLFFTRIGSDTELISEETLDKLEGIATYINPSFSHLLSSLVATLKKPQFLMLIALFMLSALLVVLTSRRRGLTALLAAVIAFGAHIFLVMCNYDAFCYIAPFYLAAIAAMLFTLDGESAKERFAKLIHSRAARGVICCVVALCVAIGCDGLAVYSMRTPTNSGTLEYEAKLLLASIADGAKAEEPKLYIGDNPLDRYKVRVLEPTMERGSLSTLLAGGYDLYSPRYAAMLKTFNTDNPLKDCVTRDDIYYVNMGFLQNKLDRVKQAYGGDYFTNDPVFENEYCSSKIYDLRVVNEDEFNQYVQDQDATAEADFQTQLDAGDPKAVYTQAYQKKTELEDRMVQAQIDIATAEEAKDDDALKEATDRLEELQAQYEEAVKACDEAAAALSEHYDSLATGTQE